MSKYVYMFFQLLRFFYTVPHFLSISDLFIYLFIAQIIKISCGFVRQKALVPVLYFTSYKKSYEEKKTGYFLLSFHVTTVMAFSLNICAHLQINSILVYKFE